MEKVLNLKNNFLVFKLFLSMLMFNAFSFALISEKDLRKDSSKIAKEGYEEFMAMFSDSDAKEFFTMNSGLYKYLAKRDSDFGKNDRARKAVEERKLGRSFHDKYLLTYYPKAFVIRDLFFMNMDPDKLADALQDIIDIFSQEPWFYFVDDRRKIKIAMYCEHIVGQCIIISKFLKEARVDLLSKRIIWNTDLEQYFRYCRFRSPSTAKTNQKKTMNLFLYLQQNRQEVVFHFYSLCFDYVIKLFNEGVLLKDLGIMNKYYRELEFIVGCLKGHPNEGDFHDAMKTRKELRDIVKSVLGIDDSNFSEDYASDEKSEKILKESRELGYLQ
jgi:hypothetical protein